MTSSETENRAAEIAFEINGHLSAEYRDELFQESLHASADIFEKQALTKRHILLVGGGGYIGTVLCDHLLNRGYQVRLADIFIYNHEAAIYSLLGRSNFEFMFADYTKPDDRDQMLQGISDVVILGGLVGDQITKTFPEESELINGRGMSALIEDLAGRLLNKVVFISTCSNYGLIDDDQIASETFELKPISAYAQAKVMMEANMTDQTGSGAFCGTNLRFATAFGISPRMRFDLTVNEFSREIACGRELEVYDAKTWRPYCHVRDFAEVIRRVLEAPRERVCGEIFNVGGDINNFTKEMIIDAIIERFPDGKIVLLEKGADRRNYRVDFSKIRDVLHFEPSFTVQYGIDEVVSVIRSGLFSDLDENRSFYGNYEFQYPVPRKA